MVVLLSLLALLKALPLFVVAQIAALQYTPTIEPCPQSFTLVRDAGSSSAQQTLSANESTYVALRRSEVLPHAWKSYLANVMATNVSLPDYVAHIIAGNNSVNRPNFGIATSGGGYRASMFGAGVLNLLDGRNSSSANVGTGGLLQAATYISGVSGGAWLITSLSQANFPTMQELVFGSSDPSRYSGWLTQFDILSPTANQTEELQYIESLLAEIGGKHSEGFTVTIVDLWARGLSRHFLNGTTSRNFFNTSVTHGAGITLSSIASLSSFRSHLQPFPLIIADLQSTNQNKSNLQAPDDLIPLSNPVFEFNVFETGSFDPTLSAFTPTQYLGTRNTSNCVSNFDQASFIAAASSALFAPFNTSAGFSNSPVGPVIALLNASYPQPGVELDTAQIPNPFQGVANTTFISTNEDILNLLDGGEDGEVIPLQPLLVKAREVDVILAIDASSDVMNFSNGASLIAAWNRTTLFPLSYSFPPVPTTTLTFTSQNLTTRPTFFGCDSDTSAPLIIYLANGGPPRDGAPAVTNTSNLQLGYQPPDVQAILDQTYTIALQGFPADASMLRDVEWPACLACAVVDRVRNKTGIQRTGVCASCFARYCWNGTETTTGGGTTGSNSGTSRLIQRGAAPMLAAMLVLVVLADTTFYM